VTNGADTSRPLLVLDFDGTVCIGDAPVWAYADALIAELGQNEPDVSAQLGAQLRAGLSAFFDGTSGATPYTDGYEAVASLAADIATPEALQRAYATSRQHLMAGTLEVSTPPGFLGFLQGLSDTIDTLLVTNAPLVGVTETVDALGLEEVIDQIVSDAGKPEGWTTLLPPIVGNRTPERVMVVGDMWKNDIAVPLQFGCATALVDRFGSHQGPAHTIGRTLDELYPDIQNWASDPADFMRTHAPDRTIVTKTAPLR
jgi:FMN phosphatase YigB (HAD superfamily)